MDASLFQQHAEIIAKRWPQVWVHLQRHSTQPIKYELINGKQRTLLVHGVQLSSRNDRMAEAQLQAQQLLMQLYLHTTLYLYGTGMGDVQRVLLQSKQPFNLEVVIMNAPLFALVLQHEWQMDWLSDPRVTLSLAQDKADVNWPFFALPPELELADDASSRTRDRLLTEIVTRFANQRFQPDNPLLVEHLRSNHALLAKDKDVAELFGTQMGRTAWIVGAGPTLQNNLPLMLAFLKQCNQRPLIVCADTAANTLLQHGIQPDFVVILDYRNTAEHLPVDQSASLALIYFPVLAYATLQAWQGVRYAAYSVSPVYNDIRHLYPRANLYASGSVIHPAIDLAVQMGCPEIVLWGVDFAFPGNKTHTGWENGTLRTHIEHADRWVHNGHGERVKSTHNFIAYLCDLERYIAANPRVHFLNTSKEGAAIAGCSYHPHFVL